MSAGAERREPHPLAARSHRRQQQVGPRGDQHERRRRGRLFQRLQQRVLRRGLHRIGLVHDHDAPAAFERPVGAALDRRARLIDFDRAGVARLDHQHVGMHAARDAPAGRAVSARVGRELAVAGRPGSAQLNSCASAIAASRFPTPSGPAKMRLGGREPRTAARAVRSSRRRCPARSRNGMVGLGASYHRPPGFLLLFLLLLSFVPLPSCAPRLLVAAAEDARPEPALLLRRRARPVRPAAGAAGARRAPRRRSCSRAPSASAGRWRRPAWAAARSSLPNTPAIASRNERSSCSGHTVGRLRALDEVLGVDHRPRLDRAVAIDHLDVVAAAVRQLAGDAADVRGRSPTPASVEPVRLVAAWSPPS